MDDPNKIISEVRYAKIKAVIKIKEPNSLDVIGNKVNRPDGWSEIEAEAPILLYPVSYVGYDGFISNKLLSAINKARGIIFGFFGGFKDFGDVRGHLIFPCDHAVKEGLAVSSWEIVEWTKKILIKTN